MDSTRVVPGADVRLRRGARTTAEFMLAFARAHDLEDDLLARLDLWRDLLTPEMVVAAGADRFCDPARLATRTTGGYAAVMAFSTAGMLTPAAMARLSMLNALDRILGGEELPEDERLALAEEVRRSAGLMPPVGSATEQDVVEALDLADVDGRLDALLDRLSATEARLDRQLARLAAEGG